MRLLYLFILCLLLSCKGAQKVGATKEAEGTSIATAVKVDSIKEEYDWVRSRCQGCEFTGQALIFDEKKPYDVLNFKGADGTVKKYYFNISSFFGKF